VLRRRWLGAGFATGARPAIVGVAGAGGGLLVHPRWRIVRARSCDGVVGVFTDAGALFVLSASIGVGGRSLGVLGPLRDEFAPPVGWRSGGSGASVAGGARYPVLEPGEVTPIRTTSSRFRRYWLMHPPNTFPVAR